MTNAQRLRVERTHGPKTELFPKPSEALRGRERDALLLEVLGLHLTIFFTQPCRTHETFQKEKYCDSRARFGRSERMGLGKAETHSAKSTVTKNQSRSPANAIENHQSVKFLKNRVTGRQTAVEIVFRCTHRVNMCWAKCGSSDCVRTTEVNFLGTSSGNGSSSRLRGGCRDRGGSPLIWENLHVQKKRRPGEKVQGTRPDESSVHLFGTSTTILITNGYFVEC